MFVSMQPQFSFKPHCVALCQTGEFFLKGKFEKSENFNFRAANWKENKSFGLKTVVSCNYFQCLVNLFSFKVVWSEKSWIENSSTKTFLLRFELIWRSFSFSLKAIISFLLTIYWNWRKWSNQSWRVWRIFTRNNFVDENLFRNQEKSIIYHPEGKKLEGNYWELNSKKNAFIW